MTAIQTNLERLDQLQNEARRLRLEGRLDLETALRIAQESREAAGDMPFDNWFEPLALAFPKAYLGTIVPKL